MIVSRKEVIVSGGVDTNGIVCELLFMLGYVG